MAHGTLSILIVDDDEGDRKHARRALKLAGLSCECFEVASIEAALEACAKRAFDCAIVDYQMPGYDGLHGIAALHEQLPFMAIIMATGQGDEMVATEAMKRGASDYIAKLHINAESIRRSIESALEKVTLRRKVAQQREELENFASVLVHDLSAPIASIQLFTRLIEEELSTDTADKDEIADHCRQVVSAGQRTGALIDTLHEYTKADADVTFEPVEMRQIVQNALSNLNQLIQERGACVTQSELPCVVGNAPQLTQLLQNLIGNGIKYSETVPPTVHITADPDPENGWLFAVSDNGIGIPAEFYLRVFEPFKRLHDASKYRGTGLGLATCKKIIERQGGLIWCEAGEHLGTTFFFTLREAEGHPRLRREPDPLASGLGRQ
jgi:signal transduction histidine kinase